MRRNFSRLKEYNENKAREIDDAWKKLISTSKTNLLNSFYGVQSGEMIPGYWYDANGKIVEGPDIYDTIADGII